MLLAINLDKLPLVITIALVLIAHYFLAVAAVKRLFSYKPPFWKDFVWHIIIQLLFVVGPTVFLIICKKNKPRDFNIPFIQKTDKDKADLPIELQTTIEDISDDNQKNDDNK